MSDFITGKTGLWDCALREVEKSGYGCEMIQDLLKLVPMEVIERKLEEAKERKLKNLPKPKTPEYYLDRMDKKEDT